MKRTVVLLVLLLGWSSSAPAAEVAGVNLVPQVKIGGETLDLNGYGIRKKLFFKIYVGSLYTAQPVRSTEQALAATGSKLIRMDFLYHKVEKEKIIGAFAEGFAKNSPGLPGQHEAREFLRWFDSDFVAGDRVDLLLGEDGSVSAWHNDRLLGRLADRELVRGVLLIYLGDQPADEGLKEGMLGQG